MGRVQTALVIATLWLVMFTSSCQFLIVTPILSRIGVALNREPGSLGLLITGYGLMVALSAIFAGPISDRVGRRNVIIAGTGLMGVALLLHAFASSFASLLGLRMLAGLASGMLAGSATAFVGDALPYAVRGRAMGVLVSAMAFGQIVGIPAGTVLADRGGYQAPFVVFGALMVAACAIAVLVLPTPAVERLGQLSVSGAVRAYRVLLGREDIRAVSAASALMMLSVSLYMVYLPTWLEVKFLATGDAIALMFLVGGLGNAIAGPLAGWASDRLGRISMVVLGSVLVALAMGLTPLLPSLELAPLMFLIVMVAASLRMSPLSALQTAMVPDAQRGTLMSLTMATGQLGFALGSGLAGPLYVNYGYATDAVAAGALGLIAAAVTWVGVPEPRPAT